MSPARLDPVRLACAAYLARFKGPSRSHVESDLRCYLLWCAERGAGVSVPGPVPGKSILRGVAETHAAGGRTARLAPACEHQHRP